MMGYKLNQKVLWLSCSFKISKITDAGISLESTSKNIPQRFVQKQDLKYLKAEY